MMSVYGFQTKKQLKAAVGTRFMPVETSMFGNEFQGDGTYPIVGPSPHERKWYATVTVVGGIIRKVT